MGVGSAEEHPEELAGYSEQSGQENGRTRRCGVQHVEAHHLQESVVYSGHDLISNNLLRVMLCNHIRGRKLL